MTNWANWWQMLKLWPEFINRFHSLDDSLEGGHKIIIANGKELNSSLAAIQNSIHLRSNSLPKAINRRETVEDSLLTR